MAAYDYEGIKALADRLRQSGGRWSVEDLLALARKNDPFYVGQPAQRSAAEWFADIWSRFEFPVGFHLRRGHYVLISQKTPGWRHSILACWPRSSSGRSGGTTIARWNSDTAMQSSRFGEY